MRSMGEASFVETGTAGFRSFWCFTGHTSTPAKFRKCTGSATHPLRTIVDLLRSGHVDRSQLKLAVDEAIRRGLIGRGEIDRMPDDKLQRSLRELVRICEEPDYPRCMQYDSFSCK